jgi:hypothetical protein
VPEGRSRLGSWCLPVRTASRAYGPLDAAAANLCGADHEVREERRGEHRLYQAFGDSAVDLVFVPGFISHIELAWEEPILNHEQYTSLTAGNISLEFSCRG